MIRSQLSDPRWSLPVKMRAVLIAAALPACFHPSYDHPTCGPHGECPVGLMCVGTVCDDHGPGDAGPDADLGCTRHAQCPTSNVCLPDGSCADSLQVAYVQVDGSGSACSQEAPCGTLAAGVATNRPFVKLATGTITAASTTTIGSNMVTILSDPGAILGSQFGDVLDIKNTADVRIYDLEIAPFTGSGHSAIAVNNDARLTLTRATIDGGDGIGISSDLASLVIVQSAIRRNMRLGISVKQGTLTLTQSTVSDNAMGGLELTGASFAIVGNVFAHNGGNSSVVGGVSISASAGPLDQLEFNSFTGNLAQSGTATAIQCSVTGFTASNNIVSDNGLVTAAQIGGDCGHTYSIVFPGTPPAGPGNLSVDPMFADPALLDLHLRPGSPAVRAADPSADLTGIAAHDIDGDLRVAPADIGADQLAR